jgi:hypothetical protein
MLRQGDYANAMRYYRFADDRIGFSNAFREYRREFVRRYIWIVPIAILLIIFLFIAWGKYTGRINKTPRSQQKYGLWQELVFAFRLMFHPFDGFWDLKHERRGSLRAAHIITAFVSLSFVYRALGTGYIFTEFSLMYVNLLQEVMNVLLPLILWCAASWALTTLMNGQARFSDIYMLTAYALLPMALFNFPATIASNFLIWNERPFMEFFYTVGAVWSVGLIFLGTMTLQQYGLVKNFITTVLSLIFMGAEMFALMLFMLLGDNIWRFITSVYREIAYRL